MTLLTSFLWKGVELNDGLRFLMATADNTLDNSASVEASYAYRGQNAPVQTGITVKEGVYPLNIQVLGRTPQEFETNLSLLKQLFPTNDPTLYPLQRKMPHEQYYVSLLSAPREFTVNRLERKVAITMHAPDKTWKSDDWQTYTFTLFDGNTTEMPSIQYDGNLPVEPIVEITPTTPGSDGPTPLYYREVTLWAHGDRQLLGVPTKIISNWDISSVVAAGRMLSGGADIEIYLPDGSLVPCFTSGPDTALNVWIYPLWWWDQPQMWLYSYPFGDDDGWGFRDGFNIFSFITTDRWPSIAAGDVVKMGDEFITIDTYNSLAATGYRRFFARAAARGVNGTTAVNHPVLTPILQSTKLKVTYGYAAGFTHYRNNSNNGWPLINYSTSDNKTWHQTTNVSATQALVWYQRNVVTGYRGAYVYASNNNNQAQLSKVFSGSWDAFVKDQRHVLYLNPARRLTRILMNFTVQATTPGNVTVNLVSLSGQIGTVFEVRRTLWTGTFAAGTTASGASSGWIDTNYQSDAVNMLAFELDGEASTADGVTATITSTDFELDSNQYPSVPYASALGPELGANNGVFPVHISFRNWNEPNEGQYFTLSAGKSVGQKMTFDCDTRTVTNILLNEVTYTNPYWLRLMPGVNNISFNGSPGTGQFTVTIKWKNRF